MNIKKSEMPVLVLCCQIGGLGIMRTLGKAGVEVYGVDDNPESPALCSRYCKQKFIAALDEEKPDDYLKVVLDIGKRIGRKTLLVPTSDELSIFVSEHQDPLSRYFTFTRNDPDLVNTLCSKQGMFQLASAHNIPTPMTIFPQSIDDVHDYCTRGAFPVMLKGIHGNRLQARTGQKMVIVNSAAELLEKYRQLEVPESPNLMLQEYIPGGDDQVYIFNGYFDPDSTCRSAFTGHKIRQFPVHLGVASLGECRWNPTVASLTIGFMKEIGYRGVLDCGYRLDPRDGKYKLLDINPRVGGAFRLFVAENGMDVVKALYLDMSQQAIPSGKPIEGRRWIIEDADLVSCIHYHWEGNLSFFQWIKSFKGLQEGAWFSLNDPMPFLQIVNGLIKKTCVWCLKKIGIVVTPVKQTI